MGSLQSKKCSMTIMATILFPIFMLPYGIRNIKLLDGRICLILFITFFGYQLIFHPEGVIFGSGADCARYAMVFSQASSIDDITFYDFFMQLDSHDNVDYFNPILLYVVSRLTTNIHIYFMVYAFIFAIFYVNNIYTVLTKCNKVSDYTLILMYIVLSLIMSIHDFGGVRMPLAFQVYLFGVQKYLFSYARSALLWIISSMLIHFSMFIFIIAFLLYIVINRMGLKYFFGLFILAHLISSVDITFMQSLFSLLPGGISDRLMLYTNEANLEAFESGDKYYLGEMNLWGHLDSIILRYYVFIAFCWLFIKHVRLNKKHEYLFKLSLYMYSVALLLSNMPSGYRFILPGAYICFASIVILYTNNLKVRSILHPFHKWYSLALILFILHRFRFILNEVGFSTLYTNFITMFFVEDNVPMLEVLKGIF